MVGSTTSPCGTDALKATRDFFIALLDLTVGYRPDFGFPGYWLYAGDARSCI
ncbi:hypothetical protein [Salinisphaera sp. LB1]|uniref:hypothetical protein n=1 Tax=Salinisphaera sp. LB1 TaxID=2183911 RepID=UPI000D7DB2D6|nr:hypothetical protein [Salinisphaera sp. LB1]AWN17961.1 hypothetical protein SALB1_3773 [Salinisphaera sp. LB1]